MDNYQAVYDAVRSKISYLDANTLMDKIVRCFDFSHQIAAMFESIEYESIRPCVMMKPKISIDGNQWCVLYGDNIQDGICGFGETPKLAIYDLNKAL